MKAGLCLPNFLPNCPSRHNSQRRRFSQRWITVWGAAAISPHAAPVLVASPLHGPGSLNVIVDSHVPKQQPTGTPGKKLAARAVTCSVIIRRSDLPLNPGGVVVLNPQLRLVLFHECFDHLAALCR